MLPGMKPGYAGILCVLMMGLSGARGWAQIDPEATPADALRFVYIHGTNLNTPESHDRFNQSVANLHPHIKTALESDPLVRSSFLQDGSLAISYETLNFFWGDKSRVAIQAVRRSVLNPELIYGWMSLGLRAREKLYFTLHDAIWLQNQSNKKAVLDALYRSIMQDKRRQPIVLMGHSAGSLVAFDLLLYRLPYIDIQDFARELSVDAKVMETLQQQDATNTCLEALLSLASIRYDAQGKLVPFLKGLEPLTQSTEMEVYRQNMIAQLPAYTRQYCLPDGMFRGMISFGSPLMLFYSTVVNPQKDESYLTASILRYMLAHNLMWLHVNHSDDFIALPLPDRQQILTSMENRLGARPELGGGFIGNYIYLRKGASIYNAHSWYWQKPGPFAQAVARAYDLGYRDWYPARK